MAKLLLRVIALLTVAILIGAALAQVAIPNLGSRGDAPGDDVEEFEAVIEMFTGDLRAAVAERGLDVTRGELITPGIAGSLDAEYAKLIAELDGVRYAVSGEVAVAGGTSQDPFVVNLIVVDAQEDRATDLISRPLGPGDSRAIADALAAEIVRFTEQALAIPSGDAGLFVSSQPVEADIYLNGVRVGLTPSNDVLMLAPGRYRLELRKEGFLPEVRTVELRSGATTFESLPLSAINGGSILVESNPSAEVYLGGEPQGTTPLFIPAPPGVADVRLERPGFRPATTSVPVRNYRTSRLELQLEPMHEPLLFWDVEREYFLIIDGVLQSGSYARNVQAGLLDVEIRRGGVNRSYRIALPSSGAHELDLETGELVSLEPEGATQQ